MLYEKYYYEIKYAENTESVDSLVRAGKTALFLELPQGQYHIAGSDVHSFDTVMGNYVICQLQLNHRVNSNPTAKKFIYKLLELE